MTPLDETKSGRPISGCQAIKECEHKDSCLRYRLFQQSPLIGFHAHQLCRQSEFIKNNRPFYIEDVIEK